VRKCARLQGFVLAFGKSGSNRMRESARHHRFTTVNKQQVTLPNARLPG
jgi:hypothetical protein